MKLGIFLIITLISTGFSEKLTVIVTGISGDKGVIQLSLFTQEKGFPDNYKMAVSTATLPVNGSSIKYVFDSLKAGTYAVAAIHDENNNGLLEKNMVGVPKEGWGVSGNINPKFRAPTFDEAQFQLYDDKKVSIILRY